MVSVATAGALPSVQLIQAAGHRAAVSKGLAFRGGTVLPNSL